MGTDINLNEYDFADFGCSSGGSIEFAMTHLSARRGLGIDIDPHKVEQTRKKGYEAEVADLTNPMKFNGRVRFSLLVHLLEHIESPKVAQDIIRTAATISSEYVLIRQPWFDSDGPLASLGTKMFWSDWSGHRKSHVDS